MLMKPEWTVAWSGDRVDCNGTHGGFDEWPDKEYRSQWTLLEDSLSVLFGEPPGEPEAGAGAKPSAPVEVEPLLDVLAD